MNNSKPALTPQNSSKVRHYLDSTDIAFISVDNLKWQLKKESARKESSFFSEILSHLSLKIQCCTLILVTLDHENEGKKEKKKSYTHTYKRQSDPFVSPIFLIISQLVCV